uniref:Nidogen-2 n=1 Tax=Denticeps clupeoides TaxID=299321 RepID=A0AAY4AKV7_9TELE
MLLLLKSNTVGDVFPYGTLHGDAALQEGDDETSKVLVLTKPMYFYEASFRNLYVATNGIISTQDLPMEKQYVDDGFPTDFPVIAPFLADLDTSGGQGEIYYRQTESPGILNRVASEVNQGFPDARFNPTHAFIATWDNVGAYEEASRHAGPSGKRNTFQAVLAYDETDTYALFLYPEDGLNFFGTRPKESYNVEIELPARVGFSRGEVSFFIFSRQEGPHYSVTSNEQSVKNLYQKGNAGVPGVWLFHIGNSFSFDNVIPAAAGSLLPTVHLFGHETHGQHPGLPQVQSYEDVPRTPGPPHHPPEGVAGPGEHSLSETRRLRPDGDVRGQSPEPEPAILEAYPHRVESSPPHAPDGHVVSVEEEVDFDSGGKEDISWPKFLGSPVLPRARLVGGTSGEKPSAVHLQGHSIIQYSTDNRETCQRFRQQCSHNADCADYSTGFCCHCRAGFFGNGRHCLPNGAPQRVNGKVSGTMMVGGTPVELNAVDLHAYIVVGDGRAYTAISEVPEPVGWALMPVAPIGGLFGWLFALQLPNSHNGFAVAGADFTRHADIIFHPGNQRLSIVQTAKGMSPENYLSVDTHIQGSVPFVPPDATVEMEPFKEVYQYYPSVVTSTSVHEFRVVSAESGAQSISYQLRQNITYRDCRHAPRAAPETQQLTVERVLAMYVREERILRYAITNRIGPVGGPELVNPCYSGSHECDTTAQCLPGEGQAYQCQCATGYGGDGRNCYDVDECAEGLSSCGSHSECENLQGSYRCRCEAGYELETASRLTTPPPLHTHTHTQVSSLQAISGRASLPHACPMCLFTLEPDVDECLSHPCHGHATCANTRGSFECHCQPGYYGNGFQCHPLTPTRRPESVCERWRASLIEHYGGQPDPRQYLPQCDTTGHFNPVQCYGDSSYCWCVDKDGREIPGTRSHDAVKPACLPTAAPHTVRPLPRPDVTPPPSGTVLLYAQGQQIGALPLNGTRMDKERSSVLLALHGSVVVGIDYDCRENRVYWTDLSGRTISRASLEKGAEAEVLINTDLNSVEGIAVDEARRRMFWVDSTLDKIETANLDGSNRQVLFNTDLVNPRPIVVDSSSGMLFWTDWNRESPKIERSTVEGHNRRVLVREGIGLPNALTYDPTTHQLCWADAGTKRLECISPDGTGRRVIHSNLNYPFSMVFYANHFYYTDWRRDGIISLSRSTSQFTDEYLPDQRSHLYGITVASPVC